LNLLSRAEVEDRQLELSRSTVERATLLARQRSEWRSRLNTLVETRLDLLDEKAVLTADSSLHTIRAPVAGTVEQLAELSPGSYVRAGQTLALISPATDLVAEIFVPSARFGMIHVGMPVRLLIDAYDYVDWGFIPGRVAELPSDYVIVDGAPMFRTLVAMTTTRLALSNGTHRDVSKGMTLRARFMVAERSLWNLIRDDINDWFNPSQPPE
jgi:HlyD family secretion protein